MAGPNTHPGDFILDISYIGKTLITSFTKFITYRKVQDRRLENLYATLSITTSMLTELGTTINKYENDFRIKDDVTRSVCDTCRFNLERLLVMVNEGISKGVWKNDGTIGGQAITAEVDPWFLITMALGGRDEAKAFWKSLDDTRDTLLELNDIVKYIILKDLNQKSGLNPEQTVEFDNLTALLPHLIQSLEKAEKAKKADAAAAAAKAEIEAAKKKIEDQTMPGLTRQNSDAASDITLIVEPKRNAKASFSKDIDCRSVSSFSSSDSGSFLELNEVYEEWILRWVEPVKNVNKSWGFFGIKFKSYYEDAGFWETVSEYRTQGEMKEQHQFAAADMSPAKHKEAMQKLIRKIPKEGGYTIDDLIHDRTESSSNCDAKREFTVVSVRPKQKYPYGSTKKWGKDPDYTDWIITIKGETIDTVERNRPYRFDDPWRKQYSRRDRSRSPPRRIRIHERSPMRPPPPVMRPQIRSRPPPPMVNREAIPDEGFRPGTLVVGKILSREEAEKKMDEIWADMTTKVAAEPTTE